MEIRFDMQFFHVCQIQDHIYIYAARRPHSNNIDRTYINSIYSCENKVSPALETRKRDKKSIAQALILLLISDSNWTNFFFAAV